MKKILKSKASSLNKFFIIDNNDELENNEKQFLVAHLFNKYLTQNYGSSPFLEAIYRNNIELVKIFLKYDQTQLLRQTQRFPVKLSNYYYPVCFAALYNRQEIINLFLKHDETIAKTAFDENGNTIAHIAYKHGFIELGDWIMETFFLDPKKMNDKGETITACAKHAKFAKSCVIL